MAGGGVRVLIASPRHTARDLERWAINEREDEANAGRIDWEKKVNAAMAEMAAWIARGDGDGYLGVSWGKDSVVVAHLLWRLHRERGVRYPSVWVRLTGAENPDCHMVRDSFNDSHPGGEYAEVVADVGQRRMSVDGFAIASQLYGDRHISGVRAEESAVRRIRTRRWGLSTERTCAPIAWWSTADVFAYLWRERLPVHPAYACTAGDVYERRHLRVSAIGGRRGTGFGRGEWEARYYPERTAERSLGACTEREAR